MKYLKRFNEELKASTYKSAATKLTQIGHKRRGAQMLDFATQREKEEERMRLQETRDELSRFEPFNLIIKGNEEKSGNFYILPNVEIEWFEPFSLFRKGSYFKKITDDYTQPFLIKNVYISFARFVARSKL
jgi:hypothetical protein